MSSFLQLLRIGFWMLPIQRALTVLGATLCILGLQRVLMVFPPFGNLYSVALGFSLMMFVPITCGGAVLRMLSSRRTVMLLPHSKGRLLSGSIGTVILATLLYIAIYFVSYLGAPPRLKPDPEFYLMQYVLTLSFATQCTIGVFIASRGPIWALLMVIVWQLPGVVMRAVGADDVPRLMAGPLGLGVVGFAWLVFGVWYLRARQVSRAGWGGGEARQPAGNSATFEGMTREQAMLRWVLAAATPWRLGVQWGLAACGLLAIQWLMHQLFDPDGNPRAAHAMMFGTLSLGAVSMGVVSPGLAARARSLWLVGGRTRLELHGWCERQMLRVVLAIALPLLLLGGLLWLLTTTRLQMPGFYVLVSMLAPGLGAAWLGLMQQHRRSLLDPLAALAIAAGWYYGLAKPLFEGTHPRWEIAAAQVALVVLLREVALVRWRSADWRRAQL